MSEIRVENIIGETGTDAVKFTKSINVTGIATATNVSVGSSVTASTFHGNGASLTGVSAGKVLQVVQGTKTDTFNTTSASAAEVTGLSVSITPASSSNKVLLSIHLGSVGGETNMYAGFTLYREIGGSATDLLISTSGTGNRPNVTFSVNTNAQSNYHSNPASFQLLDSPNTTSAITYKVKVRSGYANKNIYVNRFHQQDNENYTFHTASTYIAQEIEA